MTAGNTGTLAACPDVVSAHGRALRCSVDRGQEEHELQQHTPGRTPCCAVFETTAFAVRKESAPVHRAGFPEGNARDSAQGI